MEPDHQPELEPGGDWGDQDPRWKPDVVSEVWSTKYSGQTRPKDQRGLLVWSEVSFCCLNLRESRPGQTRSRKDLEEKLNFLKDLEIWTSFCKVSGLYSWNSLTKFFWAAHSKVREVVDGDTRHKSVTEIVRWGESSQSLGLIKQILSREEEAELFTSFNTLDSASSCPGLCGFDSCRYLHVLQLVLGKLYEKFLLLPTSDPDDAHETFASQPPIRFHHDLNQPIRLLLNWHHPTKFNNNEQQQYS